MKGGGDQVVPVIALGMSPLPFALPPFHHALELDVFTMLVLSAVAVTDPSGTLILGFPGVTPPVPIFIQAFALTQNPGWFPGSFTHFVRI